MRPKTTQLHEWLWRVHIAPTELGGTGRGKLTTPMVRQWRAGRIDAEVSEITTAKVYRLLRAALKYSGG